MKTMGRKIIVSMAIIMGMVRIDHWMAAWLFLGEIGSATMNGFWM